MENTPNDTLLPAPDNIESIPTVPDLTTPHFDEEAIQHARPAVPLEQIRPRRSWPLVIFLMCASSLIGGVLAIALSRYQNRSAQISTPPTSASQDTSQPKSDSVPSQTVANTEEQPNNAQAQVSSGKPEATRAFRTRENPAVDADPKSIPQDSDARATLRSALDEWIAASNTGDIQRQMDFYHPTMNAFYLKRNVPRAAVRAEKSRVFSHADLIDIRAAAPGIRLSPDGRTATMRFRKKYAIEGGGEDRRGEVLQELRWVRTDDGWKIVSERDLRVIQ